MLYAHTDDEVCLSFDKEGVHVTYGEVRRFLQDNKDFSRHVKSGGTLAYRIDGDIVRLKQVAA